MKRLVFVLAFSLSWAAWLLPPGQACEALLTQPSSEEYYQKMQVFIDNLSWQITDLRFDFWGSAKFNLFLRGDQVARPNDAPPEFQAQRMLISQIVEEFFKLQTWPQHSSTELHQVSPQLIPPKAQAMVNIGPGTFIDSFLHDAHANIWHKMAATPLKAEDLAQPLKAYQNFVNQNGGIQEEGIQVKFALPWPRSNVYLDGPFWGAIKKEPRLLTHLYQTLAHKAVAGSCAHLPAQGAYDKILKDILTSRLEKIRTYRDLVRVRHGQSVSLLALLYVLNRPDAAKLSAAEVKKQYFKIRSTLLEQDKIFFYFVAPTWEGDQRGPLELFALEISAAKKIFPTPPQSLATLDLAKIPAHFNWPIRRLGTTRQRESFFLRRGAQHPIVNYNYGQIHLPKITAIPAPHARQHLRENLHHAYQTIWNNRQDASGQIFPDTLQLAKENMHTIYQWMHYLPANLKGVPAPKNTLELMQNNEWQIFFADLRSKGKKSARDKISFVYLLDFGACPFTYGTTTTSPITKPKK